MKHGWEAESTAEKSEFGDGRDGGEMTIAPLICVSLVRHFSVEKEPVSIVGRDGLHMVVHTDLLKTRAAGVATGADVRGDHGCADDVLFVGKNRGLAAIRR